MTIADFTHLSAALADAAAAAGAHVVEVQSHRSLASGFVWRDDLIVTADETLADDGDIAVEFAGGRVLAATLVGRDPATDVALLRVAGAAAPPAVFDAAPARAGAGVLIVAAADSAPLVAFGIVAAAGPAWQSMRGGVIDARIELDLRLRRRAEGGLALAGAGHAIGMAVRGPRGRTLVIPAATLDRVAGQLAEHGRVPVAWLGAGLRDVPVDGGRGTMVMTVDAGGPAARADLRQGDIVLAWDGERLRHAGALLRRLRATPVGQAVTLGVQRGGAPVDVTVTIGDRPAR